MTNAIRLVNGGAIQVRTGVLQGIGPQGPRGLVGPVGPQGNQGDPGPVGPQGAVSQYQTLAEVSGTTTLTTGTATLIAFSTVIFDDLACATSSTIFTLHDIGDYLINTWIRFSNPAGGADGTRLLYLNVVGVANVAYDERNAVTGDFTYVNLTWPIRTSVVDQQIRIYGKSTDNESVGVSDGAISILRVGAGAPGPAGPTGPAGPIGPQGVQGNQGPAGNASSGFTHYSDLV